MRSALGKLDMENNEISKEKGFKKVEGFISFTSGVISIFLFSIQYPLWSFGLIPVFVFAGYLYFREEFDSLILETRNIRENRVLYWLNSIRKSWMAVLFILIGVAILGNVLRFTYREIYFFIRQGWVEKINFNNYESDLASIHFATLRQSDRALEVIQKINPVIYIGENLYLDTTISFEAHDVVTGGEWDSNTVFNVEITGPDPRNEFLQPVGNFLPNHDELGYKKFPIKSDYTIFIMINNCASRECFVRLHVVYKPGQWSTYPIRISLIASFLESGFNRFNGLIVP